jgi:hypothetical protein
MVDALARARRWLMPGGVAIDLRPAHPVAEIEIGLPSGGVLNLGGAVVEEARRIRHRDADAALRAALALGMFTVRDEHRFSVHYYAETPAELRDHLATQWRQTRIDDATHARTIATLEAHPGSRLWLREQVAIRTLVPR